MTEKILKLLTITDIGITNKQYDILSCLKGLTYIKIMNTLNFVFGILLMFWLPLSKSYITIFIFLWMLTWILEGKFKNRFKYHCLSKTKITLLLLPVIFYILHIISFFLSDNKNVAAFDLEVKLSMLIFPILIVGTNKMYRINRKTLLISFLVGLVFSSLICLVIAFINSVSIENGIMEFNTALYPHVSNMNFFELVGSRFSHFSYTHLSYFHHPAYFAMFLNFGIVIAYYLYRMANSRLSKVLYFTVTLFFSFMVYLLSSRAGLLVLTSVFLTITIVEFFLSRRVLVIFLSLLFSIGIVKGVLNSQLKNNINAILAMFDSGQDAASKEDDRMILWKNALQVGKSNSLMGVGIGDVKSELFNEYKKQNYLAGIKFKLNVHNQYLETFIGGGVLMLLSLVSIFVYGFYYAIAKRRYLFASLLFIVAINIAFESMLNTMGGVIFIMLFYALLVKMDFKQITQSKSTTK